MNIDGNDIRTDSIDGVTEIDVRTDGANEGTDKILRGTFEILVRGNRVKIYRAKRSTNDKTEIEKAKAALFFELNRLREPVVKVFT